MILAGIDEAGYGPLLGPLVVGCCALRIERGDSGEMPCAWERLKHAVSRRKSAGGRKLHINDSKVVYSPATGLKELERSVLAMSAGAHGLCATLDELIGKSAPESAADLAAHPWYQPADSEAFPIAQSPASIAVSANALNVEMRRNGVACPHLAALVVCEKRLNAMFNATRNKGSCLFSITAIHLDQLLRRFGQEDLTIVCDRQGGRQHYGELLRMMFDEWALTVELETPERSDYLLKRGGHEVRVAFWEKAEAQCMPVALASMLGKYLREALMGRFNAYWARLAPGVAPTAGYYTDGLRFLRDIEPRRKELGIPDAELIRSR